MFAGKDYELTALHYLLDKGLILVTENFSSAMGEIDLIMLEKNTLVFVEVRFRKQQNYGGAIASVTTSKQKKIIKTARLFLLKNNKFKHYCCRFDVIAMSKDVIEWLPNAFENSYYTDY